jgi:hypothetical protein
MKSDLLQLIQTLQFSDRGKAEALLLSFLAETFPLDIQAVELRPQAVSLNSFNGFLTLGDGRRLFFKTHTEQDNVIGEYYNAAMLHEADYPVILPVHSSTRAGQHLLIYEAIDDPSVFDVAWSIEQGDDVRSLPALTQAQTHADRRLYQIYLDTLAWQSADEAAAAPVHQLFWHRITGGRLRRFYQPGRVITLPGENETGDAVPYAIQQIFSVRWTINGQRYDRTIFDLIQEATRLLEPRRAAPAIVGHGDAHNGNVFFRQHTRPPSLLYFDPAFAGCHHPLLDLAKPLFHNVFAMWMYHPQIKRDETYIMAQRDQDFWTVDYEYRLPAVRHMFLRSKVEHVLIPTLVELKRREELRRDWRAYLKAALFCCPFLTLNLANEERFPPEIALLGLAMAVEMGAESAGERSLIDRTLDEVEAAL